MTEYNHLRESLTLHNHQYEFYNVAKLDEAAYAKLPFCMRILLETLVRNHDGLVVKQEDVQSVLTWSETHKRTPVRRVPFIPSRVVLQDFSGIPAMLSFASIRDACSLIESNRVQYVNPLCPTDLILDHAIVDSAKKISVQKASTNETIQVETGYIKCPFHEKKTECAELVERNRNLEFDRSKERLAFLKWTAKAFKNILLIPPFNGISHQTNIECLARVLFQKNNVLYPDSMCGTDTHSSLLNALGVFSLSIGAIEAETVMMNQPYFIDLPHVIGVKLTGTVNDTVTSVDVTLAVVKHLRQLNVNNKYIEFFGSGVRNLSISERESISYMCNEYCALVSYFPIDSSLIAYLSKSGRSAENVSCIESYLKAAQLFQKHTLETEELIEYSEVYEFDLSTIVATCSGPKRSQDKVNVDDLCRQWKACLLETPGFAGYGLKPSDANTKVELVYDGERFELAHGSVVNASIASYTNTSNPAVMLAAGLLAKKAFEFGLKKKPYIKTSLSPGSGLITKNYLTKSGMLKYLAAFGFNIVGYGCSECIDNAVDLPSEVAQVIEKNQLITVGVLSGNRNFENRINTIAKANYLVSPALVVVYAITGRIDFDFINEPIGYRSNGQAVYLKDIWPTRKELQELELNVIIPEIYSKIEQNIWLGNSEWDALNVNEKSLLYNWNINSTYIRRVPFLDDFKKEEPKVIEALENANVLILTKDSVTTDHISAAGSIPRTSPAAKYLVQKKVQPRDFNSFGSRRGNHEIMSCATFSNIRCINQLVKQQQQNGKEALSAKTLYIPLAKEIELFEAVEMYKQNGIPLIIIAGLNYGSGPSRDWAVKGQWLMGIKAILAESYDQDHRINLIRMGILPLKFLENQNASTLKLTGMEKYTIESVKPESSKLVDVQVDNKFKFQAEVCIYSQLESNYYRNGGQINYLTRKHFLKSCN